MHLLGIIRFVHDVSQPAAVVLIEALSDANRNMVYRAAKRKCAAIDAMDVPDSEDTLLYNFCAFVINAIEDCRVVA